MSATPSTPTRPNLVPVQCFVHQIALPCRQCNSDAAVLRGTMVAKYLVVIPVSKKSGKPVP